MGTEQNKLNATLSCFQITLILKITMLVAAELPQRSMYLALAPLLAVVVSVPLRAAHNAYTFLRPTPQET